MRVPKVQDAGKGLRGRRRPVWQSRFFHGIDEPHELFSSVRDGNIVMLALRSLLSKIGGEGRIPMADVLCGVVKGVAKVSGTALFHV